LINLSKNGIIKPFQSALGQVWNGFFFFVQGGFPRMTDMRPQVVIAVLLVAVVAVVGIYFLKKSPTPSPAETVAIETTAPPAPESEPPKPVQPANPPAPAGVAAVPVTSTSQAAQDPAAIRATVKQLETLQWNDDPASLQAILTELTNSSPVVRHLAIEATIQFRDRAAIPVLRDLAARTENPAEKKELLDAADFMALPTLKEARAAKKAGQSAGTTQP
jgi:hypothetical protein